jgi:hypothetical protein
MDRNFIAGELLQAAREMTSYGFELPPEIERLRRPFKSSIQKIQDGIEGYQDVMNKLARMDYVDAERIGKRGSQTARERLKSWSAIQDDFLTLEMAFEKNDPDWALED